MSKIKLAINGFGRIGRMAFKQALAQNDTFEVVAINDLAEKDNVAYLLQYDSTYKMYDKKVEYKQEGENEYLVVDGARYPVFAMSDPTELPWGELGVDVVIESTGVFATTEKASAHIQAGAKRVVISAPTKDDATPHILMGSNSEQTITDDLPKVSSNASCTTNAVVPVLNILNQEIGIIKSVMSTVHGYTATQAIIDSPAKKDFLRGRAAAVNIIPSHTGAAVASAKALPEVQDKFDALALRVPVVTGSLVDLTFVASRKTSVEEVNRALENASQQENYKNVFSTTTQPLVSTDIIGAPYASVADLSFTRVVDGDLVKVLAWYDNEYGYVHTLLLHTRAVGELN